MWFSWNFTWLLELNFSFHFEGLVGLSNQQGFLILIDCNSSGNLWRCIIFFYRVIILGWIFLQHRSRNGCLHLFVHVIVLLNKKDPELPITYISWTKTFHWWMPDMNFNVLFRFFLYMPCILFRFLEYQYVYTKLGNTS